MLGLRKDIQHYNRHNLFTRCPNTMGSQLGENGNSNSPAGIIQDHPVSSLTKFFSQVLVPNPGYYFNKSKTLYYAINTNGFGWATMQYKYENIIISEQNTIPQVVHAVHGSSLDHQSLFLLTTGCREITK